MRNAELEEAHAGIKIAGRNINNLRYSDEEYTEELYKKDLHDPDNHDGVITHYSQTSWSVKSSGP